MKKLILHVGTGKTGTTALQAHLAANRAALSAAGILYPDLMPIVGGQRIHHNALTHARVGDRRISPAGQAAIDALAADPAHDCILLSSEALGGGVGGDRPRDLPPDEYFRLRREFLRTLAAQLDRFEVHPVIVLRRQDTHLESRYKQLVKRYPSRGSLIGSSNDFASYREATAHLGDYDTRVAHLRDQFGETTVLRYEDGNIIDTFVAALDLPPMERTPSDANVSAPAALTDWMRAVPVGTVKEREDFANSRAGRFDAPGARTLWESEAARDAYLARFADHTYGGDFFPPPRPIPPRATLSADEIAALAAEFGHERRERAVAARMSRLVA